MYEKLNRIAPLIEKDIADNRISGASVCVIHKGNEIYSENFGYADRENKKPMTDDTIFRLFSMTKPITAAAAMILLERGVIRLTDPVKRYIGSFNAPMVIDETETYPAERDVTIHDLLNMTSGISYPEDTPSGRFSGGVFDRIKSGNLGKTEPMTTLAVAEELGKCPLAFTPGKQWLYGASADVMGAVIERAADKSLGDFMKDEIFTPLGMNDTGFYIPPEKYSRLAQIYVNGDDNIYPFTDLHLGLTDYRKPPSFESGGAGLVSTVSDYSSFAKMLLNKGRTENAEILGRKTAELMLKNYLSKEQLRTAMLWDSMKGFGYGCYMRHLEDNTVSGHNSGIGEYGWDGWTGNFFSVNPSEELIYLYFIQNGGAGTTETCLNVKSIVYSAIP